MSLLELEAAEATVSQMSTNVEIVTRRAGRAGRAARVRAGGSVTATAICCDHRVLHQPHCDGAYERVWLGVVHRIDMDTVRISQPQRQKEV